MHQLLLATRNSHKTREFAEILGDEFEVRDLADAAELPAVEETGLTFEENAILKAVEASRHFPGLVVADDSGLEVDACRARPAFIRRVMPGESATDARECREAPRRLAGCDAAPGLPAARSAALWLWRGRGNSGYFDGVVEGDRQRNREAARIRLRSGFQPNGFDQTFAELPAAEKNRISHRARAIRALRTALLAKFCLSAVRAGEARRSAQAL